MTVPSFNVKLDWSREDRDLLGLAKVGTLERDVLIAKRDAAFIDMMRRGQGISRIRHMFGMTLVEAEAVWTEAGPRWS